MDPLLYEGAYPRPAATWTSGGVEKFYRGENAHFDGEDREPGNRRRVRARLEQERTLLSVLGAPVYKDTTVLVAKKGEWIGECVVDRVKVKWSLWAPHHRLLVDMFPRDRDVPPLDVLEAKKTFADAHRLKYVVVPPGHAFGFEDIEALIDQEEAA